ncbi:MAG: hypothetical protein QM811_23125 [Pirellulales bacterium]
MVEAKEKVVAWRGPNPSGVRTKRPNKAADHNENRTCGKRAVLVDVPADRGGCAVTRRSMTQDTRISRGKRRFRPVYGLL